MELFRLNFRINKHRKAVCRLNVQSCTLVSSCRLLEKHVFVVVLACISKHLWHGNRSERGLMFVLIV